MDHSSSVSSNTASTTISAASSSASAFSSSHPSSHPVKSSRSSRERRHRGKKTSSSSSSSSAQKKLSNTGALLDQYQDDDDLTTNLLHAIRSWNLERPENTSVSNTTNTTYDAANRGTDHNHHGPTAVGTPNHDCNSTIHTISDIDTATMASCSSTITSNSKVKHNDVNVAFSNDSCNGSTVTNDGSHISTNSANNSAVKKMQTPCRGNYSSRPSGLTARILLESEEMDMEQQHHDYNGNTWHVDHDAVSSSQRNSGLEQREARPSEQEIREQGNDNTPVRRHYQNAFQKQEEKEKEKENNLSHKNINNNNNNQTTIDSAKIIQEIASEIGLDPINDIDKLVPTIKKLVRVVMVHVPNLEQFVDDVLDVVKIEEEEKPVEQVSMVKNYYTTDDDESGMETDDYYSEEGKSGKEEMTKKRRRKRGSRCQQRRKQPKKKNLQARKKKMDNVVQILKQEWHGKSLTASATSNNPSENSSDAGYTTPKPRRTLQKVNFDNIDPCINIENDQRNKAKSNKVQQETNFHSAVLDMLKMHHHDDIGSRDLLLNTNDNKQQQTQALDIIQDLINFEQRYRKVYGIRNENSSHIMDIQSPPQSDVMLRELFDVNVSKLRQFVLHFAYLFSVRQDEIMNKMNDIYVFSHEASDVIDNIRKGLDLPSQCPLPTVSRRFTELVKFKADMPVSKAPPLSLLQNQQQRNQHVRFNVMVEEFS